MNKIKKNHFFDLQSGNSGVTAAQRWRQVQTNTETYKINKYRE